MNLPHRVHSLQFSLFFLLLLFLITFTQSRHIPKTATQPQLPNRTPQFLKTLLLRADEDPVAADDETKSDTDTKDDDAKSEEADDADDKKEDDTKSSTSTDEDDKTDDTTDKESEADADNDETDAKAAATTEPSTSTNQDKGKDEEKSGFSGNLLGALIAIIVAAAIGTLLWWLWRKRRVANMNRMTVDDDFTQPVVGRGDVI